MRDLKSRCSPQSYVPVAPPVGVEPTTNGFESRCSAVELQGRTRRLCEECAVPEGGTLLSRDGARAGGAVADVAVRLVEDRHRNAARLSARDFVQQRGFAVDPAHDEVVPGGCAELRARREAGMRDLDRTEGRRQVRADENVEVRDSPVVDVHGGSMRPAIASVNSASSMLTATRDRAYTWTQPRGLPSPPFSPANATPHRPPVGRSHI